MCIIKCRSYYSSRVKLLMNHSERTNANFLPVRLALRIREIYRSGGRRNYIYRREAAASDTAVQVLIVSASGVFFAPL